MKKIHLLALICALFTINANAQDSFTDFIREDTDRAAYVFHNYETFGADIQTPAPAGYKPFYISHFGRHGSRYHSSDSYFNKCLPALEAAEKEGLLTVDGKGLLDRLRTLRELHEGQFGILTQLGGQQHKDIAARMYRRFPKVFAQKDRKEVICVSSTIQRCLQSMANFTSELSASRPDLDFHFYTGEKYMERIAHGFSLSAFEKQVNETRDSLLYARLNPDRLMSLFFNDSRKAQEILGDTPQHFLQAVFNCGAIIQDLDEEVAPIFPFFTTEELSAICYAENSRDYSIWAKSIEFARFNPQYAGQYLLDHIIECADAAVAGNGVAADLRFGHDSGLAPTFFLMGVDGFDWEGHIGQSGDHWICGKEMCMASNIQMIFYRNRKGGILVKILHNEAETTIKAVPAFSGPYYKWEDLRAYLVSRLPKD